MTKPARRRFYHCFGEDDIEAIEFRKGDIILAREETERILFTLNDFKPQYPLVIETKEILEAAMSRES